MLQGPTHRIWQGWHGPSGEINATVGLENKFYNIPTLVPGQHHLAALLNSGRVTPEQLHFAIQWARMHGGLNHPFTSESQALAAEQAHHALLDQKFRGGVNDGVLQFPGGRGN